MGMNVKLEFWKHFLFSLTSECYILSVETSSRYVGPFRSTKKVITFCNLVGLRRLSMWVQAKVDSSFTLATTLLFDLRSWLLWFYVIPFYPLMDIFLSLWCISRRALHTTLLIESFWGNFISNPSSTRSFFISIVRIPQWKALYGVLLELQNPIFKRYSSEHQVRQLGDPNHLPSTGWNPFYCFRI